MTRPVLPPERRMTEFEQKVADALLVGVERHRYWQAANLAPRVAAAIEAAVNCHLECCPDGRDAALAALRGEP